MLFSSCTGRIAAPLMHKFHAHADIISRLGYGNQHNWTQPIYIFHNSTCGNYRHMTIKPCLQFIFINTVINTVVFGLCILVQLNYSQVNLLRRM